MSHQQPEGATDPHPAGRHAKPAGEPSSTPQAAATGNGDTEAIEVGDGAFVYYDADTDPDHPTWVLRYTNAAGRGLIEVLTVKDRNAPVQAIAEARRFISTNVAS